MDESGAVLREVGTTNRTRISDYENAITEKTRLLLRVHPSNFTVTGFTEKPEVAELIALGERRAFPVIEDLGSGCLVDLSASGIREPTARASVEAGFSLVLFSGDKLLGGPQAGIIAGRAELVAQSPPPPAVPRFARRQAHHRRHGSHIARLSARCLERNSVAAHDPRLHRGNCATRQKLAGTLQSGGADPGAWIEITDGHSLAGGGSAPAQSLPTKLLRIRSARYSAADLETRLRQGPTGIPIIARIEDDRLLLDLRTVFPQQDSTLANAVAAALT